MAAAALAACLHVSAATTADPRSELQPALGAAGLEDAAGVVQGLKGLGLARLQDVRLLDAEEAREVMGRRNLILRSVVIYTDRKIKLRRPWGRCAGRRSRSGTGAASGACLPGRRICDNHWSPPDPFRAR